MLKTNKITVITIGTIFLVLLGVCRFHFGTFGGMYAWLNGESIYIYPKKINLGTQATSTKTIAVFHLKNLTHQNISIVGEQSSCSCAFSEKIPLSVPAGNTTELKVNIHLPRHEDKYDQIVSLMVAEPEKITFHPVRITAIAKQIAQ